MKWTSPICSRVSESPWPRQQCGGRGRGGEQSRVGWMGQGRMATGPSCSSHLCDLQLCCFAWPPSKKHQPASQTQQTSQISQGPRLARGPIWRNAFFFFFFLLLVFLLLFGPLVPSSRLMGRMEICEWWQAGIIQDKRACDVLRFFSCPQLENRPARLGISHQRRPARYLTAAMQAHAARSSQHAASTRPRHRPHRNPPEFQYPASPSLASGPGRNDTSLGKAPGGE